jgi:hypothetical protein
MLGQNSRAELLPQELYQDFDGCECFGSVLFFYSDAIDAAVCQDIRNSSTLAILIKR